MNHEDTKEGLRHCSVYHGIDSCSGCPYHSGDFARNGCENDLMFNALLLIEELEASLRAMQRTVHELTARQ